MKELSVFVDESGDFGSESHYYLLSFVLHDQSAPIIRPIQNLTEHIKQSIQDDTVAIHSYPLIRREGIYKDFLLTDRQKLFDSLVAFMRRCKLHTKTIIINKKHISNSEKLEGEISFQVNEFLNDYRTFFNKFDRIIVYYDRGQKQISKILFSAFLDNFDNVDVRVVKPSDYCLFQVADLTCTLEILDAKKPNLTKSEISFFGNIRRLKKNYLKVLYSKRL